MIRRNQFVLCFVALLLCVALYKISGSESTGYRVRVVNDGDTAIEGVLVIVRHDQAVLYQIRTGKDGTFELPKLGTQPFDITFDADGYVSERLVGQYQNSLPEKVRLLRSGTLIGRVVAAKTGYPVPAVKLVLWKPGNRYETLTDSDSNYTFLGPSGKYRLTYEAPGFSTKTSEEAEIIGGATTEKQISLRQAGLLTGKIVFAGTGEGIPNIYFYVYGSHYYSAKTGKDGAFSIYHIEPGSYTVSIYHEGFKPLRNNRIEIREGESLLNQIYRLEPLDPQFHIYTYQQAFVPGEKVNIQVRSYRIPEFQCALYLIPQNEVREKTNQVLQNPASLIADKKPIRKWVKSINIKDITRWQTRKVEFSVASKGVYILHLSNKQQEKHVPLFYTDLGLIVKSSPDSTLIWAHRLQDSKPVPNAEILRAAGKPERTDSNGLLRLSTRDNSQMLWAFSGADVSYTEFYSSSASQSAPLKAYVYTDRPVYRPSHLVRFKGIVRRERKDFYEVVANHTSILLIRDVTGTVVFQQTIVTDAHGTFFGEFQIADEPSLGTYSMELEGIEAAPARFKVLAYRKPEFEIRVLPEKERYMNGDTIHCKILASYYYGAPVANKKIEYSVLDQPYYDWYDDQEFDEYEEDYYGEYYYGYGRVISTGQVDLNEQGEGNITVPITKEDRDRYFRIEAKVTDASRREVTGETRVLVTRGEFKIGILQEAYVYESGERISMQIRTTDYENRPVSSKLELVASYERWNKDRRTVEYKNVWTKQIQTSKSGSETFTYRPSQPGYLRLEVSGNDNKGNTIRTTGWIWIAGTADELGYWPRAMQLIPDRKQKKAGETGKVLIQTNQSNVYALVTLEGSDLHHAEVVHIRGNTRLYSFVVRPEFSPSLFVNVTFHARKQFYSTTVPIQIQNEEKTLKIRITPEQSKYKPRDTVRYAVEIRDAKNNPVSTDFSFALVDEAIFSVSPEMTPDVRKFFYGPRSNRVSTYHSFPPRYLAGADKDGNKDVRKDFPDTAFWAASVKTDGQGKAVVDVKLPDSLTTWRATVRAVSDDTRVGSSSQNVIATKDLIARLEPPRFFTKGDSLVLTGLVHNLTSAVQTVDARVEVDPLIHLEEKQRRNLELQPGELRRLDWKVRVLNTGTTRIRIFANSSSDSDAMELNLPVIPFGIQKSLPLSGQISTSTKINISVPVVEDPESTRLTLHLSPSVAGVVFDSLEYLAGYPYGCVEQTMSRFLPDLLVQQTMKRLNKKYPQHEQELPKYVQAGLQRLYSFQHDDGGWGWWNNDQSDPFMSAYVIYGLSLAREAGYAVDEGRFSRGIQALKQLYLSQTEAQPYILFSLALAKSDIGFVQQRVGERSKNLTGLDPYNLSLLALSAKLIGNLEMSRKCLEELKKSVAVSEQFAFWPRKTQSYGWLDNEVETTAYALRVLLEVEPDSLLIPKIVRWLVAKRQGNYWYSTKDTAATIISLLEYLKKSGELTANYTATFLMNGTRLGAISVTENNAWNFQKQIVVREPVLRAGQNQLEIRVEGTGILYYSGELKYFENGASVRPAASGIQVRREYFRYQRTPDHKYYKHSTTEILKGNVKVGEEILVKLTLDSQHEFDYVMLEDRLPSGFEVVTDPADQYEWTYWYCRREVRDDRIAFFASTLWKGHSEIYYVLRAEVPGQVQVSPAQSWTLYLPDFTGNSSAAQLKVVDF